MNAPSHPSVQSFPLEAVVLGKNYRHRRPPDWQQKLDELARSMKENGQLEPVLGRPHPKSGGVELIFGERRYRAAKIAKLPELLVMVRDVSDEQVLELQVAENNGRENPHPLDEAEGTPADIAASLGRDPSYVAKRLALTQLSKASLEAFDAEKITFGVALLLARVRDPKMQAQALASILNDAYDGPMSVEEARKLIEDHFMLRLEKAPFDRADAGLVPKAGSCTTCPKRTGAQRELFSDVKSPDLCTDRACYRAKSDAVWKLRKKNAGMDGTQIVEGKEADAARNSYGTGKFRRLDDEEWLAGKRTTVRKLLGKELPPVALARDSDGEVFEVVPRKDVERAVRAKQDRAPKRDSVGDSYAAEQRKTKLRRKAITLAIEQAVAGVGRAKPEAVTALVIRAFAARAWNEIQTGILDRRGVKRSKGEQAEKTIIRLAKSLEGPQLLGLGLELAMRAGCPWGNFSASGGSETWLEALKLMKIDFAALQKRVTAETKAVKAGKKPAAPKAKGRKP